MKFKFEIPKNADGSAISYSPGWFGTMTKCPKNVTVLMYNDVDGFGIAETTDTFTPPEVIVLSDADAQKELDKPKKKGVYTGADVSKKWEIEEAEKKAKEDADKLVADAAAAVKRQKEIADYKAWEKAYKAEQDAKTKAAEDKAKEDEKVNGR